MASIKQSAPRNACGACGEDFSSLANFDAHRVGAHAYDHGPERPDGRRCLSVEEIAALGFERERGRWSDPAATEHVRQRFAAA